MVTWNEKKVLRGETRQHHIQQSQQLVKKIERYKHELSAEKPDDIKHILDVEEELTTHLNIVGSYDALRTSQDTTDEEAKSDQSSFSDVTSDFHRRTLFVSQWIKNVSKKDFQTLIESPCLEEYAYSLQQIRKGKPYMLSDDVEKALSIKSPAVQQLTQAYQTLESQITYEFEGEELTRGEISKHMRSADQEKRRKAYDEFYKEFTTYKDVFSDIYTGVVKDWSNEAIHLRKYESPLHVRSHGQDIPRQAVNTMLETIQENIDIYQEFFSLHKDLLGVEEYDRRDIYAPISTEKEYEYEESLNLVLSVYNNFHPQFKDIVQGLVDDERIHSHPQKNKRSGAFCLGPHNKEEPYVMLNHTDDLNSVYTMAHEFGHAIHYSLSKKQKNTYYDAVLPIAETASIFGEMLLTDRLLQTQNEEQKKAVITNILSSTYASIPRQAYFVLFEQRAHQEILNGKTNKLSQDYMELLEEQFGDLDIPEYFEKEWTAIPHIYRTPFYCYAYAWGNLLTLALYDIYKEQGKEFKQQYIELLSNGSSKKPQDLLEPFEINIESKQFWQRGFNTLQTYLDELKNISQTN